MTYKMTCEDCGTTWTKGIPQKRCIKCCGNDVSREIVTDDQADSPPTN